MAKTDFKTVDQYIAAQPQVVQAALRQVREIVRKAIPDAEEGISYQIPVYKLGAERVLFFAGWKEHFSLYPVTSPLLEEFEEELAPYEVSKGTIRFPLARPVPAKLIGRIAKFRAKEIAAAAKAKTASKKR